MTAGSRAPHYAYRRDEDDSSRQRARGRSAGRLAPILLVMAVAQILDLVTFAFAVERWGIGGELGPLAIVYNAGGYWAVAAVKSGMIALVMAAMAYYPWQSSSTPWRIGLVAAFVGVFGAATNTAALL